MTDKPETPPKRKPPQPSKGGKADPEQYARFLAKARELGCEENADRLAEVIRRAAKLPHRRDSLTGTRKGKNPRV